MSTEKKYTKGQWVADGTVVYRDSGVQPHICTMTDYFDEETTEANAVLIAAAPDMYEALQYAMSIVDLWKTITPPLLPEHEDEARALALMSEKMQSALTKATNL